MLCDLGSSVPVRRFLAYVISVNLAISGKLKSLDDNIDLFFRARNNIAVILKDMREMPGIMRRMPPLP
ncbi:hypothetical protein LOK49_Contig412G00001 [Camellia lanceoleosa]|nr:hypothetical protein LOK49_Contig412G00001 [Camellia lanceoleosa]